MNIDCRWPGSVHEAKVFAKFSINKMMRANKLPITYEQVSPNRTKVGNYLIGDPAYPLTPYCLKEFHSSNNKEVLFNTILHSTRNPVDCAFGRLKARQGFLSWKVELKLDRIPTVVYACFALNNICEINNCYIDPEDVQQQ